MRHTRHTKHNRKHLKSNKSMKLIRSKKRTSKNYLKKLNKQNRKHHGGNSDKDPLLLLDSKSNDIIVESIKKQYNKSQTQSRESGQVAIPKYDGIISVYENKKSKEGSKKFNFRIFNHMSCKVDGSCPESYILEWADPKDKIMKPYNKLNVNNITNMIIQKSEKSKTQKYILELAGGDNVYMLKTNTMNMIDFVANLLLAIKASAPDIYSTVVRKPNPLYGLPSPTHKSNGNLYETLSPTKTELNRLRKHASLDNNNVTTSSNNGYESIGPEPTYESIGPEPIYESIDPKNMNTKIVRRNAMNRKQAKILKTRLNTKRLATRQLPPIPNYYDLDNQGDNQGKSNVIV